MRLKTYTDSILRVPIRLAVQPAGLTTIADIANGYGMFENHLMKVVHQLGLAGYVETVRGRNGGLRLARPPAEINIGEVVCRMEPDLEIVPCFNASGACIIQPARILKSALDEALDAFLAVLDRYTLADLTKARRKLFTMFPVEKTGAA